MIVYCNDTNIVKEKDLIRFFQKELKKGAFASVVVVKREMSEYEYEKIADKYKWELER